MARQKQGWRLYQTAHGTFHVRFRHNGQRYKLSTGERDPARAQVEAARIYQEAVSGHARPVAHRWPLDELVAKWLEAVEPELAPETFNEYKRQWLAYLLDHFKRLDNITAATCDEYTQARLREVTRSTVCRELTALRRFLDWCERREILERPPAVRNPPARALGTRASPREIVELTREQAVALVGQTLERTRSGYPARAFFTVMWETGLRYRTVCELEAPGDYRKGANVLRIRPEIDKARFGRTIPIAASVTAALDSVYPDEPGPLFGRLDLRVELRRAGRASGLDEAQVARLSYHDLRHAALMDLGSRSTDLTALAFLAGHRNVTTTAKYVRAREAGARRALDARDADAAKTSGPETGTSDSERAETGLDDEGRRKKKAP